MNFKYILFDLDGTISESAPGITKAVQFALSAAGVEENDISALEKFIGPPLDVSFKKYYGFTDADITKAVDDFRIYYNKKGIFECELYEGFEVLLDKCRNLNIKLGIASSKPEPFVIRILEYFGIKDKFDVICGSNIEEEREATGKDSKSLVVEKAMKQLLGNDNDNSNYEKINEEFAMVGDRCFDIKGAISNKVVPIGVTYGYGTEEELIEAGTKYIAKSVKELEEILTT